MSYREEDFLMLSGIQHFLFCRRQWALIHIEQQWEENIKTIDGQLAHRSVHDPTSHTRRGDVLTIRGLKVHSTQMGISGECDAVEFHLTEEGIPLAKTPGLWQPYPVEYKRGLSKKSLCDEAQLCAQGICLEEMFCCDIEKGYLFYGKEHRRKEILFTKELREATLATAAEMHQLYARQHTPKAHPQKACRSCSLKDICLPALTKNRSATKYMNDYLET